jgi:hypothetical protein
VEDYTSATKESVSKSKEHIAAEKKKAEVANSLAQKQAELAALESKVAKDAGLVKKLKDEKEPLTAKRVAAEELVKAMKASSTGKQTPEKQEKL